VEQAPQASHILEVVNIEVVFNSVIQVLRGVSLAVPPGGVVALLGANGAGKTTPLKPITGWMRLENGELEKGEVRFEGERIDALEPALVVHRGIALAPEGRRVFPDLTVAENLIVGAHIRPQMSKVRPDMDRMYTYFPALAERRTCRAGLLSGGEQQMLSVARALMSRPRLLCLDEPSLGLAPLVVAEIFDILRRINRDEGVAVLMVEQNAGLALDFAEYGYIMETGKVVLDGPSRKLRENEDVKEFYLGLTDDTRRKSYADVKHYKRRKRWLS